MAEPVLARIELHRLAVPLTTPYHLSFGDVHAFDTVLAVLTDADGREGVGEATVLTGYTDETIESSWATACALAGAVVGRPLAEVMAAAVGAGRDAAFTATAFATALEMLRGAPVLNAAAPRTVPLLGTINEVDSERMAENVEQLLAKGYRTLKIKAGLDPAADAARIRRAQSLVAGRAILRVDANQGFSAEQARRFAAEVPPEGIELLEQPCKAGDWDAHMQVVDGCPLPLMLDESIYAEADIDRAAASRAAALVKVKLMKFVTLDRLTAAIRRIRAHGMGAVLGNGVATDIGCWMEACVAAGEIVTAGEMNGWLKQRRPLVANPMRVADGAIRIPAGYRPEIDWDAVDAVCTGRHSARA
jgi:L-alanine-DL-glutamate epimerase-like enolase superfamily enzyme